MTQLTAFASFIRTEMAKRDMSVRQFAMLVGVAHTTIGRLIDGRHSILPTLDLLNKLAEVTDTDICELVRLIYPSKSEPDAEAMVFARQISALPEDQREVIRTYLLGLSVKMGREKPKSE